MENDEALFYRHRARFNELACRPATDDARKRRRCSTTSIAPATTACAVSTSRAVQRAVRPIHAHPLHARLSRPIATAFAGWTFTSVRLRASCRSSPDDFVYADPPYDVEFTHYARAASRGSDQERTAPMVSRDHAGPVVLVNQATERDRGALPSLGLRRPVSRRAAAHQLHRRSHAGAGDHGDQESYIAGPSVAVARSLDRPRISWSTISQADLNTPSKLAVARAESDQQMGNRTVRRSILKA